MITILHMTIEVIDCVPVKPDCTYITITSSYNKAMWVQLYAATIAHLICCKLWYGLEIPDHLATYADSYVCCVHVHTCMCVYVCVHVCVCMW